MTTFAYTALEARTGREVRGTLEASDARGAAAVLRERSLLPVALDAKSVETTRSKRERRRGLFRITRSRDVVFLLRQLALMLRAGLTLLQALDVARENARTTRLANAVGRIRESVEHGQSLAEAIESERRLFPELCARLVASAEASGELDATLDRVAENLDRSLELRRTLLTALAYPSLLVTLSLGVVVFLVVKVIPTFARFLERRRVPLPWATRALMDVTAFLRQHGVVLALSLASIAIAFALVRRTPRGRRAIDRALLSVPLVGGAIAAAVMAQAGQTLAMLLRGGVTLLEALRLVSRTLQNAAVSARFADAAEGVLRGQDLASGLDDPVVPLLFTQVVAVGERTGALDHVLLEVGTFYEAELRAQVQKLTVLFEPCVVAVVGGLVGFVYFAFFQALLQLAARGH